MEQGTFSVRRNWCFPENHPKISDSIQHWQKCIDGSGRHGQSTRLTIPAKYTLCFQRQKISMLHMHLTYHFSHTTAGWLSHAICDGWQQGGGWHHCCMGDGTKMAVAIGDHVVLCFLWKILVCVWDWLAWLQVWKFWHLHVINVSSYRHIFARAKKFI
jgi:hypothetical protein